MQDIINLLSQVAAGLDGIAVRGMADREMLSSCVRGLQSAIGGLEGLAEAATAPEQQEEATEEHGG